MSLDHKIDISISLGAPSVSRAGFGTVLILDPKNTAITGGVKTIAAGSNYAADGELSTATKAALDAAFAQKPFTPSKVLVSNQDQEISLTAALNVAKSTSSDWFGLVFTGRDAADIKEIAAWCEANQRMYFAQSSDADIIQAGSSDVASFLKSNSYQFTALAYHDADGEYLDAGWLTGFLARDFDSRAPTAVYQTVAGVQPGLDDRGGQDLAESKNANYYSTLAGIPATFGGTVADGHAIEQIVTGAWFKARLREAIAQLFLDASDRGERIPYNDSGIARFEQVTRNLLKRGEDLGHFTPGTGAVKMPRRVDVSDGDVSDGLLRYECGAQYSGVIKAANILGFVSLQFPGFEE